MNCWILDTRATDHVACSISVYTNYYKIKLVMVKLPNNQRVTAFFAGTVFLTKDIILHNVLYIPEFMINIISMQRLKKSLKCQFVFTHDVYQIQEKLTLKTIGQAEIKDELYHMYADRKDSLVNSVHNEAIFKTAEKLDIWHCRMGHASNKVLEHLAKTHSDIHFNHDNICSPCHLAKQHKLPFQLSKSLFLILFTLTYGVLLVFLLFKVTNTS